MKTVDPIFVAPRFVQREWGRVDPGNWLCNSRPPEKPIAEAWILDPANATDAGPLGHRVTRQSSGILGDLGRAPPRIRLVFPNKQTTLKSASPVSFWTVLEPGVASLPHEVRHRTGERFRTSEGAKVTFAKGCVALELSSSFLPTNSADPSPNIMRLPPVSARSRATLLRDTGLSVESWALPEWSRLIPDGETCHALVALDPGVRIDGHALTPGEAVLVPAEGRPLDVVAKRPGAKLLVAYPDRLPTAIWRHAPGPDPTPGQLPKPAPSQPPDMIVSTSLEPAMAA